MSLTPRQLEDEANLLAGLRVENTGLEVAYMLGAQHALEWQLGHALSPHERLWLILEPVVLPSA